MIKRNRIFSAGGVASIEKGRSEWKRQSSSK
jgi:hypothetical protein